MNAPIHASSALEPLAAPSTGVAGHVMDWDVDPARPCSEHERATRRALAERIAELRGYRYFGPVGQRPPPAGPLFFVPSETLECHRAYAIGIRSAGDFFGGAVPFGYVATKAITHPVPGDDAACPRDWVASHAARIRDAVLPGYSAFTESDARRAGRDLLRCGKVRVKPVRTTEGNGHTVVHDADALDRALAAMPHIASDGVVLERDLREPRTLCIGQVRVGAQTMSYFGLHRLTPNHRGDPVYGGCDLTAVRGGFDVLTAMRLAPALKLAIGQAALYRAAVGESFPGFMASRINYDVIQGCDDLGTWRSGVLGPSWRVGGASGAEVAALEAFKREPERQLVRASCIEVFGEAALPSGARVLYHGVDPQLGPLTTYSFVEAHADAT